MAARQMFFALLSGLVLGLGLIISGMNNPMIVGGFLDLAGAWNPNLALVMVGAIAVGRIAFYLAEGRSAKSTKTWLGNEICLTKSTVIDKKLIIGSAIFGIGWGMFGVCPGPAVLLMGSAYWQGILFVLAMLLGMYLVNRLLK